VLGDSEVPRNRYLRLAAKRWIRKRIYLYIIDAATGVLLHIGAGADDVTPKVKTKLGVLRISS